MNNTTRSFLATVLACGLTPHALAQTRPAPDLAAATIEDLMSIEITSSASLRLRWVFR